MSDDEPLLIGIVGAESTGKTTLALALAARLSADTGLRCQAVGEVLRTWCEEHGRTPRVDEQAGIARAQGDCIDAAAAAGADVLLCDTTPLMVAVYSRWVFNDRSLEAGAAQWQRRCALTLLTALDLPWVADGLQREGPHVQGPIDAMVRELLTSHSLPFTVVGGEGGQRLDAALEAIAPLLRDRRSPLLQRL